MGRATTPTTSRRTVTVSLLLWLGWWSGLAFSSSAKPTLVVPLVYRFPSPLDGHSSHRHSSFMEKYVVRNDDDDDGDHDVMMTTLTTLRGGATRTAKSSSSSSSSFLLTKLRHTLRSLIQVGERKSPTLTKVLRTVVKQVEQWTGVSLLVVETNKRTKRTKSTTQTTTTTAADTKSTTKTLSSKKRKSKKRSGVSQVTDNEEEEVVVVAPVVTKTRKATKTSSKVTQSMASKQHLEAKYTSTHANYRIQRELKEFLKSPPPNLSVKVGSNIRVWIITMTGANHTVYEGETYKLRVSFPPAYPTVPPSVYFLSPPPLHEHVYTNGDICLSLLGKGWRPTMTAQSIAVSILSILSSADSKSLPMDNARHCHNPPGQYQKDWVYHDDNC